MSVQGSARALELDAASYTRHALHGEERVWVEKNCYIDIWIELVHALGLDPQAMLGFTAAVDFEGDQWTFFKPPHTELRALYGLDVQELTVWRPLVEHALEHLAAGKLISTEADAFWLPDTHGTDYRTQHTKTTIVLADIDVDARRLGYFHNAAYYALAGEDFEQLFRIGAPPDPTFMPLFAELVRKDRLVRHPRAVLVEKARAFLAQHVAGSPTGSPGESPIDRFAARFAADLPSLTERGLGHYHQWAFATVRQLGAAMELLALHLGWLDDSAFAGAAESFLTVSQGAKAFILKAARAVNGRRALDASATFGELAAAYARGMDELKRSLGVG